MNNLERLAKQRFEQFSKKETGKMYNWYYLPHERKIAWMREIIDMYDYVITEMKTRIELEPIPGRMNTTYAMGRAEGVNSERQRYLQSLTDIIEDFVIELEEFIQLHNSRNANEHKGRFLDGGQ